MRVTGPKRRLPAPGDRVNPAFVAKLRSALSRHGREVAWSASGLPVGVRFVRVPLRADLAGWRYTALVPVGAVSPKARLSDPNLATYFFVERQGGPAGATEFGGPLSV